MSISLIDDGPAMADDGSLAGRYAAAFAQNGTQAMIANAASRTMVLRHGERAMPISIDDGGYGHSYVASPHSAYVLYARAEMDIVAMRRGRWIAHGALSLLDGLLRSARINRAVHLDNWLLSTNLHGTWDGSDLSAIRHHLARHFPDHFLILRSLDDWSCPALLAAAQHDGWIMLPARQIWVVDDLKRDWQPRRNHGHDRRALARSGLTVDEPETLDGADCARIADLYSLLYVDRYCALNPIFTPRFIAMTHKSGMLSYRVARNADGLIMAVAGMLSRNGMMTPTVVGYDTKRPKSEGLYRIASYLFCDWAMARGLALHGSAGAASFKRHRGAHGVIEHMAVYAGHLTTARRAAIGALAIMLNRIAVPMMQRQGW